MGKGNTKSGGKRRRWKDMDEGGGLQGEEGGESGCDGRMWMKIGMNGGYRWG